MKVIRNSFFETNSSSIHTIAICKTDKLSIPNSVSIKCSKYGWESNKFYTTEDKLNYLMTALVELRDKGAISQSEYCTYFKTIINLLEKFSVEYVFEASLNYGIDSIFQLYSFIIGLFKDNNKLIHFLFNKNSIIITASDEEEFNEFVTEDNFTNFLENDFINIGDYEVYVKDN